MNCKPQKKILLELRSLIEKFTPQSFTQKNKTLFGASIGEHFRHIIEFYLCCLNRPIATEVNYDLRKRDKQLEVDIRKGIDTIDHILKSIHQVSDQDNFLLQFDNCLEIKKKKLKKQIHTSIFRELVYCMDHCIHHQSLIKIALLEQELIHLVDDNFGVSFSTQSYRNQCA